MTEWVCVSYSRVVCLRLKDNLVTTTTTTTSIIIIIVVKTVVEYIILTIGLMLTAHVHKRMFCKIESACMWKPDPNPDIL